MRILKTVLVVLVLSALPLRAAAQQISALDQVVDRIISQEQTEMNSLRSYSPLVETSFKTSKGIRIWGPSRPVTSISWAGRCLRRASIWNR